MGCDGVCWGGMRCDGVGRDVMGGMGSDGMGRVGLGWGGVGYGGMMGPGCAMLEGKGDGMEWVEMGCDRAERDRLGSRWMGSNQAGEGRTAWH